MIHCYKHCGYNIVLDIASGSIHSVDAVTYDVILSYELILDGKKPEVLINRIMEKHPNVTESDIRAIIIDIEMLRNRGKLFSADEYSVSVGVTAPGHPQLTALCLNVSHVCNMTCTYCFAGKGEYSAGENSNETKLMSLETGKQAIDFLVRSSGTKRNLDIDFFGGEPLLNWEVVKEIVAYAREVEKKVDKRIRFTLTTNGLLIDDEVISFVNKEIYNVVLSLDGRPETHDAMRKINSDNENKGSYSEVLPKIKKLVETRRHKGYYIRGTFTRENMDFTQDILHLADLGFTELSLEPAVTKRGDSLGFTKQDLPELFRQYDMLAVEMLRRKSLNKGFNFYHYMLDLTDGPCIHKRIAGCGVGTEYLAVTPSGELYPCHQFVGDNRFLMGNVKSGVLNKKLHDDFAACNIYSRSECKNCWARYYCSGGCVANAYYASGSINGIYDIGCEVLKRRIENAIMMKVGAI